MEGHCNFVGFSDLFGLRPGLVGDAGLTTCIPTVFDASLQRTAEPPLIFILRQDELIGR